MMAVLSLGLPARAADGATFIADNMRYTILSETDCTVSLSGSVQQPAGEFSIPSSVTNLGKSYAVTEIGKYALMSCKKLTSVTIPSSVTVIGELAFAHCYMLTSVPIPASVTRIERLAFYDCTKLTAISIPASVTEIGDGPFKNCTSLEYIRVENGNPNYISEDGCLFDIHKTTLIQCPGNKKESYAIPDGVIVIADYALSDCGKLTSVSIPNTVTKIGQEAFYRCVKLTSLTLPESVTEIGQTAFSECEGTATLPSRKSAPSITLSPPWS